VKAALCDALETHVWPLVRRGLVRPVLAGVWPLEEAAQAHEAVLHGEHVGAHALLP
jgi:NADPH:quinone reductase-like Zn-dependent oxidoreductase